MHETVRTELMKLGFSRQFNCKAQEGSRHPDRNAQFKYINAKVIATRAQQQPGHLCRYQEVRITRTGNFKNGGIDCRPKSDPVRVNVHDFEDKKLARSCLVVAPGTSSAAAAPNPSALLLLDCHRFRQIAGLVDIFAHDNSGMVGEHLEGDGVDDGREIGAHFGHR